MSGYSELIGRKVVVTKNDGYRKYGILKKAEVDVLVLIFNDGREEYIPLPNVASVSLDLGGNHE